MTEEENIFFTVSQSYTHICCCRRLPVFGRRCAQSSLRPVCVCVCVCDVLPLLSKRPGSRDTLPWFVRSVLSRCHWCNLAKYNVLITHTSVRH